MEVGYLVAPEYLMKEIKSTSVLVFSVNSICQVAISEYLDIVSVSEIGKLYQEKRDYFRQLLKTADSNSCRAKELIFKWRHMQLYQMRMMLILQTTY
jgi:aspartate/methionine/tyrosine aminotransferase